MPELLSVHLDFTYKFCLPFWKLKEIYFKKNSWVIGEKKCLNTQPIFQYFRFYRVGWLPVFLVSLILRNKTMLAYWIFCLLGSKLRE